MALPPQTPPSAVEPGAELRARIESLGAALADSLSALIGSLPERAVGPQALGHKLGITTVTASRLLKAIGQKDPIATIQLLPGPNPLRRVTDAAEAAGAPVAECTAAREGVTAFENLIRDEAGDRGSLKAMLSAWLPNERREFEAERRQSIFKALFELDGISSELEVTTIVLHPAKEDGRLDIVNIKSLLGIDRIRPDSVVRLGTRRMVPVTPDSTQEPPRVPLNLDGEPALNGLHTVRLDEFCDAPPAPLVARELGEEMEYSLGPTGFGRQSKVDLVIAEVNRSEIPHRAPNAAKPPFFFSLPEMPTRRLVIDLLVHEDVYPDASPEIVCYDATTHGMAVPGDPARDLDRRVSIEPSAALGTDRHRLRLVEFPRYTALVEHVLSKLEWQGETYRSYRISIPYSRVGVQVTFAFFGTQNDPE